MEEIKRKEKPIYQPPLLLRELRCSCREQLLAGSVSDKSDATNKGQTNEDVTKDDFNFSW